MLVGGGKGLKYPVFNIDILDQLCNMMPLTTINTKGFYLELDCVHIECIYFGS